MAAIGAQYLTLADLASRMDPSGKVADIVDLLSQTNEILDDMLWTPGNLPTGNKTTVRTGLPTATWRQLYQGVPRSKGTTAQVIDTCGMLEAYALTDKALVDLADDKAGFRMSEELGFIEGMNQQMAATIIYGNAAANPERFTGLAPRYSSLSAGNGGNIIDAGGTGSTNTSIWVVCWGPTTAFGIVPKNSTAGLQQNDVTTNAPVLDANGNPFQAYQTHYRWDAGVTVRDWRYVVRIANIDAAALAAGTGPNLAKLLIMALRKPPTMPRTAAPVQDATKASSPLSFGRVAIYCNRTVSTWLDLQVLDKTNVLLNQDRFENKPVTLFRGIPIRTVDAILNTEARVI